MGAPGVPVRVLEPRARFSALNPVPLGANDMAPFPEPRPLTRVTARPMSDDDIVRDGLAPLLAQVSTEPAPSAMYDDDVYDWTQDPHA